MPAASADCTNRSRYFGLMSASKVMTFVPASRALVSESPRASGSLADITIADVCFCASVSMYCACASGLASCGPTWEYVPPNSLTAASPPASLMSK